MNKKEILLIFLIICSILSLQAIAASSDLNITDENVLTSTNVSAYALPESNDLLQDGSVDAGTFSDLQNDISGDNIVLEKNYTYDETSDSGLSEGITISSSKTIDGQGNVIIDANKQASVFNIASGATVTLKGITFINAFSSGNGGSINSDGVLNIIDCNFINNTAEGHGGAIYLENSVHSTIDNCNFVNNLAGLNGGAIDWRAGSSNGKVINSNFINNTAERSGGAIHWSGYYGTISNSNFTGNHAIGNVITTINGVTGGGDGGAVLWVGSHGIIDNNCNFINNFAKYRGGAIFLHGNSTENCTNTTITQSLFKHNIAGLNGGAIDWQEGAHDGRLTYSIFINNSAWRSGGAVYWYGTNGTVDNCEFINNSAIGNVTKHDKDVISYLSIGGNGGAITWIGKTGNVKYCNFTDNTADKLGGAVYLQGNVMENCTNTTFDWCRFVHNIAGLNGGAIDWHEGAHDGNVYNSVFNNNVAKSNGGAIFWSGHNGEILYSNFTNNSANGIISDDYGNKGEGGAIIWTGLIGVVDYCRFINNSATNRGGAVFLQNCSHGACENTTFSNCYFNSNHAGYNGGAIDWYQGAEKGAVINSTFINNTAERSGGAIYWSGKYGRVINSNFTDNKALGNIIDGNGGGDGAAILWVGSHGVISQSNFTANNATYRGGAIFLKGSDNVTIDWCNFDVNWAGSNGGAVDFQEGATNGRIFNSTFVNNTALRSGGAVYWFGTYGTVRDSNFTDNRATAGASFVDDPRGFDTGYTTNGGNGGAIVWTGSHALVDNCNFINNSAAVRGGAVFLQRNDNSTFSNSHFIKNTAGTNGGALDWFEGALNGRVINDTFVENTAKRSGGAIYWYGDGGIILNSNFTDNCALGIVNATNSFGVSTVGGDGGALIWTGSNGLISNAVFENNTAKYRGGAIFLQKSSLDDYCENTTVFKSTFINNVAGTNGGAIDWFQGAHDGLIDQSQFINNSAKRSGGAVYWSGDDGNITNSNFTNNRALGIVNVDDRGPSVVNYTTLGGNGGAIIWTGDNGYVDNCRFINNTAPFRGGAVYLQRNENATFKNSLFANNTAGTNGGAIDWYKGALNGLVDNVTFINNTAKRSGGAIYWYGENGEVKNSIFYNNRATGEYLQYSMSLTYDDILVVKELPDTPVKGKLYILDKSTGKTNIWYESYAYDENWIQLDQFDVNGSASSPMDWGLDEFFGGDGGSILWSGNNGLIDNCLFDNSNSARRGGGAYMTGGDNITYSNCNFTNCTSGTNGGGVDWLAGANYGKLLNCIFIDNRAARSAGSVYYDGDWGQIINVTIKNSYAYGGLLKTSRDGIVHYVGWDSSHWDTNTTGGDAGAIMFTGNHEYIYNVTFTNCTATGRGGAIFLQDNDNITFVLCEFTDNSALGIANNTYNDESDLSTGINKALTGNGGAIDFGVGSSNTTIKDSKFKNNIAARNGGAVCFETGSECGIVLNSTFDDNTAKRSGGAIYWYGYNGTVKNSKFENNRATGETLQYDMDLNYDKIILVSKTEEEFLKINPTEVNLDKLYVLNYTSGSNHVFKSYVAHNNGTSLIWLKLDETEVNADTMSPVDWALDQFLGGDGGTILWSGDLGDIINCTFKDSNSARRGGGAYMTGSDYVSFKDCNFTDCTSGTNGGGVDWLAGANYGKIYNCIFNNTRAARSAGAIYYDGWYGEIVNITIINTKSWGGSLKESKDGKVKYVGWDSSHWDTNTTGGDAGAIMFTGNHIYIYNATFTNCTSVGRGGAVFLQNNVNITFDSCKFYNNTALGTANNTWSDYTKNRDDSVSDTKIDYKLTGHGGAVAFDVGAQNCIIKSSEFINNTGRRDGGAINFAVGAFNNTIKDTIFISNYARDDGGAINWEGNVGIIENITCYDNKATGREGSTSKGGTICLTGNNVTIAKSNFTLSRLYANTTEGASIDGTYGGAIFVTGNDTKIIDTVFDRCYSPSDAGAIYVIGNKILIDNCTFTNCNATEDGGVLSIHGQNAIVANSTFINNTAGDDGGAINWEGNFGKIYNITCENNKGISLGGSSSNGGTIILTGSNVTIEKSSFKQSYALISGGAIFVTGNYVNITDSSFEMCNVSQTIVPIGKSYTTGGGSIYVLGNFTFIDNCTFDKSNGREGGALYIQGSDAKINNVTITHTYANQNGGTFYILGPRATISNSNISMSNATVAGGAGYIEGVNTNIINTTFNMTNAKNGNSFNDNNKGGAIYIKGNYANISGSKFDLATAQTGGSIYLEGSYCNITNSSFDRSHALKDGGSIYSTGSYSNVVDSNFTNSVSDFNGGSLYWYGGTNSVYNTVEGCIFYNNTAYGKQTASGTRGGGAIYWSENGKFGKVLNSKFINNSVQSTSSVDVEGGAILWDYSANIVIDNSIFDGNYIITTGKNAWVQGGAIYLRSKNVTISNSVFENCWSSEEAGALYISNNGGINQNIQPQDILVINTKFINNTAKGVNANTDRNRGGGAVQVKESYSVVFINATFENNTASQGGACSVIVTKNNDHAFYNCTFTGNDAIVGNGGGLYSENSLIIYNSEFIDNHAVKNGGGAYWTNGNIRHDNLTFINNNATLGGGLYWDASVTVQNMNFINNTAENGGAVYLPKATTIKDVIMTGNKAFSGSAIYATNTLTLNNVYLMHNRANSSSLTFLEYDESTGHIVLLFKGWDNYLNGIFVNDGSKSVKCTNVVYWDADGVANTGSRQITLNAMEPVPTPEGGQNITVEIRDDNNNLLNSNNMYFLTDNEGKIYLDLHDIVSDVDDDKYGEIYVEAFIEDEDIYTAIKLTTRAPSEIDATANVTTYHSNSTVYVNVTHGATGNVSVYLNDVFLGNITLNNSKGLVNISTLIEGRYLPVGKYNLSVIYGGNAKYDESNTTAVLEIIKTTPIILVNVTNIDYTLIVNVTVKDGYYNISDATGNVTIKILDRTATIYLANSQGLTIIYGVSAENHTIHATYNGDDNYNTVSNSTDYEVKIRTQSVVEITVEVLPEYWVNDTARINVTLFPETEGNITLYLNGVPYNLTLVNSAASLYTSDLKEGLNTVVVTFSGNTHFVPSWAEATFIAKKFTPAIIINATDMLMNESQLVNITLPDDAEGIVKVNINGSAHYYELVNGSVLIPVSDLAVGQYNITVIFNGDDKYTNLTNSTLFNVLPIKPDIKISAENVTYGNKTIITVTLPDDATGNVTLKINDTLVEFDSETLVDGQARFEIENLPAGNYTVEVIYNGNKKYTVNSAQSNFTVFKADVELEITVQDIPYGEVEHIIVTVKAKGNAQGNVTITVAGNTTTIVLGQEKTWILKALRSFAEIEDYNNNAKWNVANLAVGRYSVTVTYNGNENFNVLTKENSFIVYQINTTLIADVHDIYVWDKESINITLADNTSGNVTININGINYTAGVINGHAQLNLTNLTVGHKVVWVFYDGDRNYTANRTMAEFDVKQRTPEINVTAENTTVDRSTTITISIPSNATGFVILSGNFNKHPIYVYEFTNGVAKIVIDNLTNGTYSVHIKYYGDELDNYTISESETTFKVGKINTTLGMTVEDIVYGQKANITVSVEKDATGYITIRINETYNKTLPIVNGKVNWIVDNLPAGNYTVYANYSGDDRYNLNNTNLNRSFEVKKTSPDLTIVSFSGVVYENGNILISINNGTAGGKLNITVGDYEYKDILIPDDGLLVFETSDVLDEFKSYEIVVEYGGNQNFTADTFRQTYTISKVLSYGIDVCGMNITVGDDEIITVEVPDYVDEVVIWINGNSFKNNSFSGNKATFNVTNLNLKEGIYTVTASVNDAEFEHKNFTTIFTVNKTNAAIEITVINKTGLYVNDTVKVIVTVPDDVTENVTIEINGKSFTNITIGGNATFYIPQITYGDKTIIATYSGDDKYRFNSTTANFTVHKRQSNVNITVDASTVGNDVTICVEIPINATGYVIVNVDGTNYTVNTTNSAGSVVIKGLGNATHKVNVTYIGDDQYLPSNNETSFGLSKINSTITVKVDNITVGDKAIIEINVPEDATGNVTTVIIDGKTYTVSVANGTGILVVPDFKVGNYTVKVTYNGDEKYLKNYNETTFKVNKITTDEITVIDQGNRTAVVVIGDNSTGNVTIKVDNETYNVTVVNGTAVVTLTNVTPGEYDIEVIYSGDDNHTGATKDGIVNIPKYETPIKVTVDPISVGDTATITVEVPENATGNIALTIDGKQYNEEIIGGKATFTIENLTDGVKTVVAEYIGDSNFTGNYTAANFTVSKRQPTVNVNVSSISVGETAVINVTVPGNATGWVHVTVGNKTYAEKVQNGTVTFEIDRLTNGNHNIAVEYLGDNQYLSANVTSNVTVSKVSSSINVTVEDIKVGETAIINVTTPIDLCGNVTVTVDGKNYTVYVSQGHGVLPVSDLNVGNHTVNVTFDGCAKYEPSKNSTSFKVNKIETGDIKVIDQGNATVVVIVGDNATGNVTVKLGNNTFNATVVNGTAVVTLTNVTPGEHDIEVIYSGDDNHTGATKDGIVNIPKYETPIKVTVDPIRVGDTATITVEVPENATGNITISIDGKQYTEDIKDGKAIFNIENLTYGNKTIAVKYPGSDDYLENTTVSNITISKCPLWVNMTIEDSNVGNNVTVKVNVPEDATGHVLVDIDGLGYYINITDGSGVIQIPGIPNGKYNATATYIGDDKYMSSSNKTSFEVSKLPSFVNSIIEDITVGDNVIIKVNVPEDATGNVTVTIDNQNYTIPVDNGKGEISIPGLHSGIYDITLKYNGDDKYIQSTNTDSFKVNNFNSTLDVTDLGNGTIIIRVDDNATGNVTVKVGNETYDATVVNGTVVIDLINTTPGKHDIEVIYSGDDEHSPKTTRAVVNIPKHNTPISVNVNDIKVGENAVVSVILPEDVTGKVIIEIDGKEYSADIKNGKAVFNVAGLTDGKKTVAVKYVGDKNYEGNFTTGKFTVSKSPSTISATSKNIKAGNDEIITVTVPKDATGRVMVDIDGVGYYATIINGKAKVHIPELFAGKYKATVTYEGDDKYLSSKTTTSFKVTKSNLAISATGDTIPQGDDATVVVTLPKDATGTVTIKVEGKKYTAAVNNGKAVFKVPGLTNGNHKVDASYSGNKYYDANGTITDVDVSYPDGSHSAHDSVNANVGVGLSKHATGNPILILLLIILVFTSTQLRRFKK